MRRLARAVLDLGTAPGDDPDLVLRKRTAVAATLAIIGSDLAYQFVGMTMDQPVILWTAMVQIIGQVANLAVFHRTRRIVPAVIVTILLGLGTVASGVISLGGFRASPDNLIWGLLVPIGGVLLLGPRAAAPGLAGLAIVVLGLAILAPVTPVIAPLPVPAAILLKVLNLLGPAAVALGLVLYVDGQRLRARRESDALLLNVLPTTIADRLKAGERVIADHFDEVSVLFADVVGFTRMSEAKPPSEVVELLNDLFTDFDRLADQFGLEKIKTIGDAYMAVAGVPLPQDEHATAAVEMGLAMHAIVAAHPATDRRQLQIRVGIASGPVVAGIIGERKFSYDLWGDTVNTAARMESSGVPGRIQLTESTRQLLGERYPLQARTGVEVKGKGFMSTWLLDPTAVPGP